MYQNKKALITGGTGTWGQEIASQLLEGNIQQVVIFSRNELSQVMMKQKFKNEPRLKFIIGDIRDARAISYACNGIDYVFHTAALKHVTKCEEQPQEAVKTNIIGTQNVIDACIANNVAVCVNISTDKVCNPTCFYGRTKAIAEGLIIDANNQTLNTDFFSVRSGNILGSAGSVLPLWIEQIKSHNSITVTNPEMTRFFITVKRAVFLLLLAMELSDRGEVFVFRIPSFKINDLYLAIRTLYGDKNTQLNIIGPRPGESLHECLVTEIESETTKVLDFYYVIYPLFPVLTAQPQKFKKILSAQKLGFYSDTNLDCPNDILELIKEAGY